MQPFSLLDQVNWAHFFLLIRAPRVPPLVLPIFSRLLTLLCHICSALPATLHARIPCDFTHLCTIGCPRIQKKFSDPTLTLPSDPTLANLSRPFFLMNKRRVT